jgi:hypothetical protein
LPAGTSVFTYEFSPVQPFLEALWQFPHDLAGKNETSVDRYHGAIPVVYEKAARLIIRFSGTRIERQFLNIRFHFDDFELTRKSEAMGIQNSSHYGYPDCLRFMRIQDTVIASSPPLKESTTMNRKPNHENNRMYRAVSFLFRRASRLA